MAGRKFEAEAEARRCLAAVEASGMALADWARSEGIDGRSLSMWRLNLARRASKSSPPRLVELVPSPPKPTRYVMRCGPFAVEVGDDFDQDTLFCILEVVAACLWGRGTCARR